jgi:diketogulonate reductase-like aldo/keto reductase
MYGRSEEVAGDIVNELGIAEKFFYATKVWTTGRQEGIDQMHTSMRRMRRTTMELMQIHNLVDWKTHLKTLQQWKEEGKIRYIGVTHYTVSSHNELEQIIKSNKIDFVQFNYSIRVRNAEKSLLNAAMDNGTAVIINEPLEKGNLFDLVKGRPLPAWSSEYDIQSWGEFFLKYIISHPAVTCVIPATADVKHCGENLSAGIGRLPNEKGRKKMIEFIEKL